MFSYNTNNNVSIFKNKDKNKIWCYKYMLIQMKNMVKI